MKREKLQSITSETVWYDPFTCLSDEGSVWSHFTLNLSRHLAEFGAHVGFVVLGPENYYFVQFYLLIPVVHENVTSAIVLAHHRCCACCLNFPVTKFLYRVVFERLTSLHGQAYKTEVGQHGLYCIQDIWNVLRRLV
jgi:hypothetical protein